jgi:hypothetical protein
MVLPVPGGPTINSAGLPVREAKMVNCPVLVHFEITSFFGGTVPHSGHRSGVARRS